jgi:hypothetical protein
MPSQNGTDVQRLNAQVSELAVSNDVSGRLSIRTAEGDTINFTADLDMDFLAMNFASQSFLGNSSSRVEASSVNFSIHKSIDVTVDGNLNDQELRDLEAVFSKVSHIFRKFLKGEDEGAVDKAVHLGDRFSSLSSLAGVEFNVEIERTVSLVTTQLAAGTFGEPRPALPMDNTAPGGLVATDTTDVSALPPDGLAPTARVTRTDDQANSLPANRSASELPHPTSLAEQLLTVFRGSGLEPRTIHSHLSSIITRALDDLRRELRNEQERENRRAETPAETLPTRPSTHTTAVTAYQPVPEPVLLLTVRT